MASSFLYATANVRMDCLAPVEINVKGVLGDTAPVFVKDVMNQLASVKRKNASVTRCVM